MMSAEWLPPTILRAVPPMAIAASALFSGAGTGSANAQEPTPPPTSETGIRLYCADAADCFITEGASPGDPQAVNTGDVANMAVQNGLIDPDQAEPCARAFESKNALYLQPDPNGGRPRFKYQGMRFDLPRECFVNKLHDSLPTAAPEIQTPLPHDNPNPPPYSPFNLRDCMASIGILVGLGGLGGFSINRRFPKKR